MLSIYKPFHFVRLVDSPESTWYKTSCGGLVQNGYLSHCVIKYFLIWLICPKTIFNVSKWISGRPNVQLSPLPLSMLIVKGELCSALWKVTDMVGSTLKKGTGRQVSHVYRRRLYLGATCDVTRSTGIGYKRVRRRKRMRAILQSNWEARIKHIFKAQIQLFHVKY